jgi:transposase
VPIVIGIDAHKNTHTCVAVEEATGRQVGEVTVRARAEGHERLVVWARDIDVERRFAVEDCRHVSGGLERHLIARGERVVRVPPKLMAGVRRQARTRGKSDPIDALAVARAALRETTLPEAHLEGPERDLRLLVDHRETLVRRRSEDQARLRWLLHDLDPDLEIPLRSLDRTVVLDRVTAHVKGMAESVAVELCLELLARIRELTTTAKEMERRISVIVGLLAPALLAIAGCGALTAAKIVGETAGVARFSTEAKFAMHAGVAPLPVWSGDRTRFRLNRSGNRQLNAAVHRIAVTQIRMHEPARLFMKRKSSEGKTKTEALRSLKRHIARKVFETMNRHTIKTPASLRPAAA